MAASALVSVIGILVSYLAYFTPPYAFNPYQAAGSVIFWAGALGLLFSIFLAEPALLAARYVRTKLGAVVGAVYLAAHLLLYGFVLEGILVLITGVPPYVSTSAVYVGSDTIYPATVWNAVVGVAFSPNINLQFPPIYALSLSIFSVVVAITVDVLILANVAKVKEIGIRSWASRSRAYVAMPAVGIFLGASCCMSLPVVLSIVSPSLEQAVAYGWVFYVTYFVLPVLGVVVLKLNLDLASRIADAASRLKGPD